MKFILYFFRFVGMAFVMLTVANEIRHVGFIGGIDVKGNGFELFGIAVIAVSMAMLFWAFRVIWGCPIKDLNDWFLGCFAIALIGLAIFMHHVGVQQGNDARDMANNITNGSSDLQTLAAGWQITTTFIEFGELTILLSVVSIIRFIYRLIGR